jgi:formylglycine-generating enzyme required for sulfatase activity
LGNWEWVRIDFTILSKESQTLSYKPEPIEFEFETVTVDAGGEISDRHRHQAKFFSEDLGGVELEMVFIPGGSFLMGSPKGEEGRNRNESPQHLVKVPPFFLGKYPVTQKQYEAVMRQNPSEHIGPNRPVENLSRTYAVDFCRRLSLKTGKNYRLPSEAEWEYACRAGTTTPFYFGPTITPELANYDGSKVYASGPAGAFREQTTDVGSFPPNAFGLYDMHGLVWEWCQDVWHDDYFDAPTDGSVWESDVGLRQVVRGGCWFFAPEACRSAYRLKDDPDDWWYGDGLRVALSL